MNKRFGKLDAIDYLKNRLNIEKELAENLYKIFSQMIEDGLEKEGAISLGRVAILKIKETPEKKGRDFQKGKPIIIPPSHKLTINSTQYYSQKLKEM